MPVTTRCLAAAVALVATVSCSRSTSPSVPVSSRNPVPSLTPPQPGATTWPAAGSDPIIAAAGDIAIDGGHQMETASLLEALLRADQLAAVLALGDSAYPNGAESEFQSWYAPSWGRTALKAITRPIPGNHEYYAAPGDATAYFDYFNGPGATEGPAGKRGEGWYSFEVGNWHVVALNTNLDCGAVACDASSAQVAWLAADLAAHPTSCTLAFFHAPRFQQGRVHGDFTGAAALWDTLMAAGADLVLAGHEHTYQQFAPMDGNGVRDDAHGMRSFVVGTGGAALHDLPSEFSKDHADAVEATDVSHWGVLELALHPTRYNWRFVSIDRRVLYAGSADCH